MTYKNQLINGLKQGFLFYAFSIILIAIQFGFYIVGSPVLDYMDFEGWVFFAASCVSHASQFALLPYLLGFLVLLCRFPKTARVVQIVGVVLLCVLNYLNSQVYAIYHFHINGFVLSMVFGEGAGEIFNFDALLYLKEAGLFAIVAAIVVGVWYLSHRVWLLRKKAYVWLVAGIFVGCTLYAHLWHIYAAFYQHQSVGNLATHLGKAIFAAGHDVVQVFSRTMQSATSLASEVGAQPVSDISDVRSDADLYVVSVKDSAIVELIPVLCKGKETKVFLHTAGSIPMDVFQGMALHYGVLYPMQTFSKQREVDFSQIPCFIEANDEYALQQIGDVAHQVSSRVYHLASEDRKYLHLSAVFACNFVNHCYALSREILEEHGIPFDVMLPLIDETAAKVHELDPKEAQTGPAVRYDENVLRAQGALLKSNPQMKDIYDRMSMSIHKLSVKE